MKTIRNLVSKNKWAKYCEKIEIYINNHIIIIININFLIVYQNEKLCGKYES